MLNSTTFSFKSIVHKLFLCIPLSQSWGHPGGGGGLPVQGQTLVCHPSTLEVIVVIQFYGPNHFCLWSLPVPPIHRGILYQGCHGAGFLCVLEGQALLLVLWSCLASRLYKRFLEPPIQRGISHHCNLADAAWGDIALAHQGVSPLDQLRHCCNLLLSSFLQPLYLWAACPSLPFVFIASQANKYRLPHEG